MEIFMPTDLDRRTTRLTVSERELSNQNTFSFIDLARLGRTDWWSGLKGLLRIVGWHLVGGVVVAIAIHVWTHKVPPAVQELTVLAAAALCSWLGVFGATVRSQQRAFLSLVSGSLRISPSRLLWGAALWLGSFVFVYGVVALVGLPTGPITGDVRPDQLTWSPSAKLIPLGLAMLALLPFQAAGEELIFRGWLTQTAGQFLRSPFLVAFIVAVLFALAHGFSHGAFAFPYYVVVSFGLSALTLMDGRLELAIGVHAAHNIAYLLGRLFSGSELTLLLFDDVHVSRWASVIAAAQFGMICITARLLRKPA
jgi:uncharacterized protein